MAHAINIVGMIIALVVVKVSSYLETVKEPLFTDEQIKMFDEKF
jgi:hypothetical protein